MNKQPNGKTAHRIFNKRSMILLLCIGLPIFIIVVYGATNYMLHRDSAYTNLHVGGIAVGDKTKTSIHKLVSQQLNDTEITFHYQNDTKKVKVVDVGVRIDESELSKIVDDSSPLSAFAPWFFDRNRSLPITIDSAKLESTLAVFQKASFKAPRNATFTVENDQLVITKDVSGYGIDIKTVSNNLSRKLSTDLKDIALQLSTSPLKASITKRDIEKQATTIKKHLVVGYQIVALDTTTRPSKKDIAAWLDMKDGQIIINATAIRTYITRLAKAHELAPVDQITSQYKSGKPSAITTTGRNGRAASNVDDVVQDLARSVKLAKPLKTEIVYSTTPFKKVSTLVDDTARFVYTYDIAVWGTVGSNLATFKALVAETFADSRGWAAAGIAFREVASGGSFTLVLAEPSYVGAQPGCSSYWSCRVGRYVIINDARWTGATDAWNAAGGGLRDYRHMVVNHESGHWLGFGHGGCPGPGQPAPVMLQQSIDLQGCAFNPWPTAGEIASL